MIRFFYITLLLFFSAQDYAWNALGHRLIAQVAYKHLSPQTKQLCLQYLHHLDPFAPDLDFVSAADWLDQIRIKGIHWYDTLHYVDIPFSKDQRKLPPANKINALWGINQAINVLASSKTTPADKGLSLAILIHLIGDIHQPLHTANKVSRQFPNGDKGGNLFYLTSNSIGNNLHQYWDNGGGILMHKTASFNTAPGCESLNLKKTPKEWIKESHEIALNEAYALRSHKVPSKKYQMKVQKITQKQILLAGCRLAMLLNEI